jgi:hypothetical protein
MNSGAEAVESAIKSVRKWGYEVKGVPDGRAEIITQPAKVIAILFASSGALRQFGNTSSALCNVNSATSAGSAFPICRRPWWKIRRVALPVRCGSSWRSGRYSAGQGPSSSFTAATAGQSYSEISNFL